MVWDDESELHDRLTLPGQGSSLCQFWDFWCWGRGCPLPREPANLYGLLVSRIQPIKLNRPADDGRQNTTIQEPSGLGLSQGQGIEIHDRDVGPHPRFQLTGLVLPTGGEGRPIGVSAERLLCGNGLFWIPPSRRLFVLVAPGHGGVKTIEDVVIGTGQVSAEGQRHTGPSEGPPSVGAPDALRAETILCPGLVFDAVGRLHGRDDPGRCEPLEIIGVDHLGVLYTVPQRSAFRARENHRLQEVQGLPIAGVTDGMDPDLEARPHHLRRELLVEAVVGPADAAMALLVRVVSKEARAARAEGRIVVGLDRVSCKHGSIGGRDPRPVG